MIVALIDGDILLHRAARAIEKRHYELFLDKGSLSFRGMNLTDIKKKLNEWKVTSETATLRKIVTTEKVELARHILNMMIEKILKETKANEYMIYLSPTDKSNFRYDVATIQGYKANRTEESPAHYDALREHILTSGFQVEVAIKQEADDCLGITATRLSTVKDMMVIMVSIDKDIDQIPGHHFNFVEGVMYETTLIGELTLSNNHKKLKGGGLKWFYAQMLLGDSGDNIPGLKGAGPVKVQGYLADLNTEDELLDKVYELFCKQYEPSEAVTTLLELADLLWIRRRSDEYKSEELKKRFRTRGSSPH